MTTNVPDYLAWPVLAFITLLVLVRYLFYNTNRWELYFNNTLALNLLCNLLRDRTVEAFLASRGIMTVATAQLLSLAVMILVSAEFTAFVLLWSGLSQTETQRSQHYRRLAAAILAMCFLTAGSPARARGEFSVLAWMIYAVMPLAMLLRLLRTSIKELRRPSITSRERLVALLFGAISASGIVIIAEAPLLTLLDEIGWVHSLHYRLVLHGSSFFLIVLGTSLLGVIPCVTDILARIALDSTSRRWKRLQDLRNSMTKAIPESAFELAREPRRRKTTLELHQTTVQIRDAIMWLRPYFHELGAMEATQFLNRHSVPAMQREAALQALVLAYAVKAKATHAKAALIDVAIVFRTRSTNLDEEVAELLQVAKWWSAAQAAAAQCDSPTRLSSLRHPE